MGGRVAGGGEEARKRRLAAALRENLKRRKAQSRGRALDDGGDATSGPAGSAAAGTGAADRSAAAPPAAAAGADTPSNDLPFDDLPPDHVTCDDLPSDGSADAEPALDITWRVCLVAAELEAERIAALVERAVEADGWPVTRYEVPPAAAGAAARGGVATAGSTVGGLSTAGVAAGDVTFANATTGRATPAGATAASRPVAERSVAVEAGAGAPAFAARLVRDEEWPWAVEVLVFGGSAAEARARILDSVGGDGFGSLITVEPLGDEDWVAKSLEGLPPVREGRFLVRGRHARGGEPAGIVTIDIEAGLAFGTGHHATTVGCLAAIERALRRGRPRRPLDLGTGTGVLAIAIARLAKVAVVASDIDPVAVRVAAANAAANGAGPFVRPFVATGMADRRLVTGGFDLVVANILARPLERLAPAIGRALAPRAVVVLSGLRVPDGRRVEAAYRRQGLVLTRRDARDGWLTLTFQRG